MNKPVTPTKPKYTEWFKANAFDLTGKMKPHFAYASSLTKIGQLDERNRKPFRNAAMKRHAKRLARKDFDGAFRTSAGFLIGGRTGLLIGLECK